MSNFRKVKSLKCYYNFFTNEEFELRSVVFSDLNKSIPVKFKDSQTFFKPKDYSVFEVKIDKKALNFETLFESHAKIKKMIKSLNTKKEIIEKMDTSSSEEKMDQVLLIEKYEIENYCKNKKSKCLNCKATCIFGLNQLNTLSTKQLKIELKNHCHPTSRIINQKNRNKAQEMLELYNHYQTVHDLK